MRLEFLSLLSSDERRQLLVDWNATEQPYPTDRLVHELFEEQVARTPDAVAVVYEGAELTYAQLNAQANQVARHLRRRGVGRDERVAVCMERSLELVVALLAVLKAEGAYVPLDPDHPLERLAFLKEDSSPALVLVHDRVPQTVRTLLATGGSPVLDLRSDTELWSDESADNLDRAGIDATNLAYVIYTSGSTGTPKGVMNEHHGLVNLLCWSQERCNIGAGDVLLLKTPIAFDASVWEFFWPLVHGAKLAIARQGGHRDPGYLVEEIQQRQVTVFQVVPSLLKVTLDEPRFRYCTSLRHLFCGGEILQTELVRRLNVDLPHVEIHNVYGPTEATVDTVAWTHLGGALPESIPIGRPIANTRIYILDERMEPVPIGVRGELYIGGAQVARGYWNRPELTAERFIPSPFVPGDRLYKTGDLARYLSDGNIDYLGRNDFQVKIRGYRIELGEIEARLALHPNVGDAVVVASCDASGEKRLVAYYTSGGGVPLAADDLRAHLASTLPEYMVPPAYVALAALPLTVNGKLDRAALPDPDGEAYARVGYEAPEGEVESTLAAIWTELLGVERVSRNDNFFALGGHSLLTMRLAKSLKNIGLELHSVATVFQYPTIRSLAAHLRAQGAMTASPVIPIRSSGKQRPLFLVHDLFCDDLYFSRVAERISVDIPVNAILAVPLDKAQPRSVEEMASLKVDALLALVPEGPYRIAGWSFGGVVAYEIARILIARGMEVEFLGLFDSVCPPERRSRGTEDSSDGMPEALRALAAQASAANGYATSATVIPDHDNFEELLAHCRASRRLPSHVSACSDGEIREICTRIAAHLRAEEDYVPQRIAAEVHLFAANETVAIADMLVNRDAGTLGWGAALRDGNLSVHRIPGDHNSITSTHAHALGCAISKVLLPKHGIDTTSLATSIAAQGEAR